MQRSTLCALLALVALMLAASFVPCDAIPTGIARRLQQTDPALKQALDVHNRLRAGHGARPLTWDSRMAAAAQAWADKCLMQNSGEKDVGENLGQGHPDLSNATLAWYNSGVNLYNYAQPGFSFETGSFTQLVWRGTRRLGCGYNPTCLMYVCWYSPAGNVQGQFEQNVLPPLPSTGFGDALQP